MFVAKLLHVDVLAVILVTNLLAHIYWSEEHCSASTKDRSPNLTGVCVTAHALRRRYAKTVSCNNESYNNEKCKNWKCSCSNNALNRKDNKFAEGRFHETWIAQRPFHTFCRLILQEHTWNIKTSEPLNILLLWDIKLMKNWLKKIRQDDNKGRTWQLRGFIISLLSTMWPKRKL